MATSISGTSGSSSSTSGSSSLGGGFDVQAYVNAVIQSQSGPLNSLEADLTNLGDQATALATIQTDMSALQTAVGNLDSITGQMDAHTATSSSTTVATATADTTAVNGSHTLTVSNLATTDQYVSNTISGGSGSTAVSGQVSIGINGGTATTITAASGATLSSFAAQINSAGLGVTATVVNSVNSSGASQAYLQIQSNTSGTPGTINITAGTGPSPGNGLTQFTVGGSQGTFTETATPQNAGYWLDTASGSQNSTNELYSTSNAVTALQGVTIQLQGTGTTTIAIAPDTTQQTSVINAFVTAYNQVVSDINTQYQVNPQTGQGGVLLNDPSLQVLQSQLLNSVSYSVNGNSNGIVNLESIGVHMNDDGTLTVDNSALQNALSSNNSSVVSFFQQPDMTTGFADNFSNQLLSYNDPLNGTLALDLSGNQNEQTDVQSQITDWQTYFATEQQSLTQQYSQVAVEVQQMPLMMNQINSQLASLP